MSFILNRLKALILVIIGGIKRALCCFRMKRRSFSNDGDDCLTHVGVVPNRNEEGAMHWDDKWGDESRGQPQTVQDHIQLYREKVAQANVPQNNTEDEALSHLFEEMTPQYIKQKRIVIGDKGNRSRSNIPDLSRLAVSTEATGLSDLGEWHEEGSSGWDEQHVDTSDIVREQRRLKREHKQHSMGLGRKLKA